VLRTQFRSLRWRATFWMAVFLLGIAIAIRSVNYYVTRDILLGDIDAQLWTRLGALKAQQRFAPETLMEADLRSSGLLLPEIHTASDLRPSAAMHLLIPSAAGRTRFPWFAGVWRDDGTPLALLRLPEEITWRPQWRDRLETIWTTADRDFRLSCCLGTDQTMLLVGTPLDRLDQAMREVLWFYAWTIALVMPPLTLAMWWLLSRMMMPLGRIARTAESIAAGDFAARIDLKRADSELVGMAATLNGMLDRLDAIRLSQARFNANLSHEILNPIHGILVQTEVSQQQPRTREELERSVDYCRGLALRIQKLSESLLALSKADSAAGGAIVALDLDPIIDEAAAQVEMLAQARHVSLDVDARSAVVAGNADLLHQVFVNLLANAIEHSPPGSHVEVATAPAGTGWMVRVVDHGPGIPTDRADRVFERFFRDDESHVTATGGHGLGLAICRAIMQQHGGDVVHRATPGGGATFEVHFPTAEDRVDERRVNDP